MTKTELVIFDVDGTLLDTKEGIVSSVKYACAACRLPILQDDMIERTFIGPPIAQGFQTAYGIQGEKVAEAVASFRECYVERDLFRAKPYSGIYELLDLLSTQGLKIAIATYKREDYARKLLDHFGFDKYTSNIHGADPAGKLKKTDIIELCISNTGHCDRSAILMVGDTISDACGAKEAGIKFLGVTYGYGFSSDAHEFPAVSHPMGIMEYLTNGCYNQ